MAIAAAERPWSLELTSKKTPEVRMTDRRTSPDDPLQQLSKHT